MDRTQLGGALVALLFLASPAAADIAVVAVDNHTVNVNGVTGPAKNPPSDHVAIVDVAAFPPKLVGTVEAPTSVVGAPTAIWIAPDGSWRIITAACQRGAANPYEIIEDDRRRVDERQ